MKLSSIAIKTQKTKQAFDHAQIIMSGWKKKRMTQDEVLRELSMRYIKEAD